MNVKFPDPTKISNDESMQLEAVTKQLEQIGGKSAAQVSAEWAPILDERGRALYRLSLSDFSGRLFADFTPSELQSPRPLRIRLLSLWGDLLQVRSHKLLEKLTEPAIGE